MAERVHRESRRRSGCTRQMQQLSNADTSSAGAEPEGGLVRYLLRRPVAIGLGWHIMRISHVSCALLRCAIHWLRQSLDLPGRPRIVAVAGHTPGSVAVHCSQTSHTVVLTGDALITNDGIAGRTGPSIVNAAFTHVTAQALDSLEALAGLDAEVVLPGHGEPFTGGVSEAVHLARLAGAA